MLEVVSEIGRSVALMVAAVKWQNVEGNHETHGTHERELEDEG
jgi:hypothetical protein